MATASELILEWGQERRGQKIRERGYGVLGQEAASECVMECEGGELGGLWERCKLPSVVWGVAPPPKGFFAF